MIDEAVRPWVVPLLALYARWTLGVATWSARRGHGWIRALLVSTFIGPPMGMLFVAVLEPLVPCPNCQQRID